MNCIYITWIIYNTISYYAKKSVTVSSAHGDDWAYLAALPATHVGERKNTHEAFGEACMRGYEWKQRHLWTPTCVAKQVYINVVESLNASISVSSAMSQHMHGYHSGVTILEHVFTSRGDIWCSPNACAPVIICSLYGLL